MNNTILTANVEDMLSMPVGKLIDLLVRVRDEGCTLMVKNNILSDYYVKHTPKRKHFSVGFDAFGYPVSVWPHNPVCPTDAAVCKKDKRMLVSSDDLQVADFNEEEEQ